MQNLEQKLAILGEAARYDASCASSGGGRAGRPGQLGNAYSAGICHTWAADGRCVSLLKVLQSNVCCFDCAYCMNRRSNDVPRATFAPEELADLTVEFYSRNYIEGLFLSSGVLRNPDYTMEQMIRTMRLLREQHRFGGYIHMKVIPGADPALIHEAGLLADRVSCNIEMPSSGSLRLLAPQKPPENIFSPMKAIHREQHLCLEDRRRYKNAPLFAPAGQSTQMIIGATPDSDLTILRLSYGLYRKFRMKRVYFSAYIPLGTHPLLPREGFVPPLLREHRLYQADWLMRFYQFEPGELLSDDAPQLDAELDPKALWAVRHPEFFPVEVNSRSYEDLLRVPGLGVRSAGRIVSARRQTKIRWEHLKKLGVVMKRAQYFVTAAGVYDGRLPLGHPFLRDVLAERRDAQQLSLFDQKELPPGGRAAAGGGLPGWGVGIPEGKAWRDGGAGGLPGLLAGESDAVSV